MAHTLEGVSNSVEGCELRIPSSNILQHVCHCRVVVVPLRNLFPSNNLHKVAIEKYEDDQHST